MPEHFVLVVMTGLLGFIILLFIDKKKIETLENDCVV